MDREKAIKIIKDCKEKGFKHTFYTLNEYHDAIDAAIKALEQEPCDKYIKEIDHLRKYIYKLETQIVEQEPCEDAISRQAALDVIYSLCGEGTLKENEWRDNPHIDSIIDALNGLPSVSTEKTGRWEWVQYDSNPNIGNWHCSECRNILVYAVKKDEVGGIPIAKYCPNCGAKMGVEE